MYRIAINGYGRIGQSILRALYENNYRDKLQLVTINDLSDIATMAYLTRYDTTHGRFLKSVIHNNNHLYIDDDSINILRTQSPESINWKKENIDLLLECSGSFTDRKTAEKHRQQGAPKLLFSQPAQPDVDATIVYGINHKSIKKEHRIISAASCTTNCIVPVLKTLHETFEIDYGSMTTIHSAMNDQPVIDAYHQNDLRLTRSALQSIIPVDTNLMKGIDRLLPELNGCFTTNCVRVPTINVSCIDLCIHVKKSCSIKEVNDVLKNICQTKLQGIMSMTHEPNASVDFNHDPHSCIVDATQTKVSGNHLIKLLCWFDNEWGFSNRMLDIAYYWLSISNQPNK